MADIENQGWQVYFNLIKNLINVAEPPRNLEAKMAGAQAHQTIIPGDASSIDAVGDYRPYNGDVFQQTNESILDNYTAYVEELLNIFLSEEHELSLADANFLDRMDQENGLNIQVSSSPQETIQNSRERTIKKLEKILDKIDNMGDDDPRATMPNLEEAYKTWRSGGGRKVSVVASAKYGNIESISIEGNLSGGLAKSGIGVDVSGSGKLEYEDADDYRNMELSMEVDILTVPIRRKWMDTSVLNYRNLDGVKDNGMIQELFKEIEGGLALVPSAVVVGFRPTFQVFMEHRDGKKIFGNLEGEVSVGLKLWGFDNIGLKGQIKAKIEYDHQQRNECHVTVSPAELDQAKPLIFGLMAQRYRIDI